MANPHAPVAADDLFDVKEFESTSGNVILGNVADSFAGHDSDQDGADTLRVVEVNGGAGAVGQEVPGAKGKLTLGANGDFSYETDANLAIAVGSTVTDTFTYRISDRSLPNAEALFDDATLTITITGVAEGNDEANHLIAAAAGSTLTGHDGDDILDGANSSDTIFGGTGDASSATDGNDTISGKGGADFLYGGYSGIIDGGDGDDFIVDGASDTTVFGGTGADTIYTSGGIDEVHGDDGDDKIRVGILIPDVGADPVAGEVWDGGGGKDTLMLNFGPGTIAQKQWTIDLSGVTIENFETIGAGSQPEPDPNGGFSFVLKMTSAQFNTFDSILFPTNLNHTFQFVDNGTIKVPVTMGNGEKIQLSNAGNVLDASSMKSGYLVVDAGGGNDRITGSQAPSLFQALLGNGDDTFTGNTANEEVHGGKGSDTITGKTGVDTLFGDADNDSIDGGTGGDILVGGAGKDRLTGGAGADLLQGDGGADRMEGGADQDRFVFNLVSDSPIGRNEDTILDFHTGEDKIDLSDFDANKNKDGQQHFDFIGKTDFNETAGELRLDGKDLQADVDGDGEADFEIHIRGDAPGENDLTLL